MNFIERHLGFSPTGDGLMELLVIAVFFAIFAVVAFRVAFK